MAADCTAAPPARADRLESRLRQLRELIGADRCAEALSHAQSWLNESPGQRDLLYMAAISQRSLGRIEEALNTLGELERLHPQYGRLYQERGLCLMSARAPRAAIEAFTRAVALNPSLPSSWQCLAELQRFSGRVPEADDAARRLTDLERLPAPILSARSMFADGELEDAERLVRRYLFEHGEQVEALRLLAQIGEQQDVLDDAELLLAAAVRSDPGHDAARFEYAIVLLKRHRHVAAREQIEILLRKDPGNRPYRVTLASIQAGLGAVQEALLLYRQVLVETPRDAELKLAIGHALKTLGQTPQAIDAYRGAATLRPQYGDAFWSLANLKIYRFSDAETAQMRAAEAAAATAPTDRLHLQFALGKALEDRADYAASFEYYRRGNALKKSRGRYRPEPLERNARLQAALCTREFFAAREGFGATSHAPIFIVGLPRAGSTLIEQILASHSQVEGTMELSHISRLVQELQGREARAEQPRYPGVLSDLNAQQCRAYGERYLAETRSYRTGRPRFIDKMPNNFRHLGLIHLILPNARLIDARREPVACCFSNYKQLFAAGQQFSYDFEDLARYHRMYVALMAHWDQALPGRVLRVSHEALIADLETQVRRLLDFCELPFEAACLEFYKTERRVHSASAAQVRRPIERSGPDQWRHFEPWLGALKAALAAPPPG